MHLPIKHSPPLERCLNHQVKFTTLNWETETLAARHSTRPNRRFLHCPAHHSRVRVNLKSRQPRQYPTPSFCRLRQTTTSISNAKVFAVHSWSKFYPFSAFTSSATYSLSIILLLVSLRKSNCPPAWADPSSQTPFSLVAWIVGHLIAHGSIVTLSIRTRMYSFCAPRFSALRVSY